MTYIETMQAVSEAIANEVSIRTHSCSWCGSPSRQTFCTDVCARESAAYDAYASEHAAAYPNVRA